eukprot:m.146154 g.146154  ORF g.146154 m.146154 type:complete len:401 (+) comp16231_c0_seq1:109-1311(+)
MATELPDAVVAASMIDHDQIGSLDEFREQWEHELKASKALQDSSESILDRALTLHRHGETLEDRGEHAEAVIYYRRAAKLVPDIEFKAFKISERQQALQAQVQDQAALEMAPVAAGDVIEDLSHLHSLQLKIPPQREIADPTSHFGALPDETIHKILALSLYPINDIETLCSLRLVCRKFYLLFRDPGLWVRIATIVWPQKLLATPNPYSSWQHLCLQRPRALYHGVYVSRASYVRQGEQSVDSNYRPFHMVKYYRYIRLFSDGQASALTSSQDPQATVGRLIHPQSNHDDIDHGRFEIDNDQLLVRLYRKGSEPVRQRGRRRNAREEEHVGPRETVFYMRFTIRSDKKNKGSHRLTWRNYMIQQEYWDGRMVTSSYDQQDHLKPFQFWRVKTYTATHDN